MSYGLLAYCTTLMGQLLQLVPGHVLDHLMDSHAWQGPKPRKFTYWSHLKVTLFGHLQECRADPHRDCFDRRRASGLA